MTTLYFIFFRILFVITVVTVRVFLFQFIEICVAVTLVRFVLDDRKTDVGTVIGYSLEISQKIVEYEPVLYGAVSVAEIGRASCRERV